LNDTIVVQVTGDNKIMINQDQSSWEALGPKLSEVFKERADKVAFVKGDDNVEFAQVARAIDIMRGSGIEHVGLITAKMQAGQ
jgi:biopolymer transport protein ExbD